MGAGFSTGTVTAAISGSVALGIPTGAVMVSRTTSQQNFGAAVDLYTVTAGKTLYILCAWSNACCTTANWTSALVQADTLGTGTYYPLAGAFSVGTATTSMPVVTTSNFSFPVPVPATKKVQFVVANAGQGLGGFVGYEI
jgi:hypothetical protein